MILADEMGEIYSYKRQISRSSCYLKKIMAVMVLETAI